MMTSAPLFLLVIFGFAVELCAEDPPTSTPTGDVVFKKEIADGGRLLVTRTPPNATQFHRTQQATSKPGIIEAKNSDKNQIAASEYYGIYRFANGNWTKIGSYRERPARLYGLPSEGVQFFDAAGECNVIFLVVKDSAWTTLFALEVAGSGLGNEDIHESASLFSLETDMPETLRVTSASMHGSITDRTFHVDLVEQLNDRPLRTDTFTFVWRGGLPSLMRRSSSPE
jgi:hypothetical protein